MASIMEILPIELTAEIIQNLAAPLLDDDKRTSTAVASLKDLKACSLACRNFRPLCQKHIFKTIELPTHDVNRLPHDAEKGCEPQTSISGFSEILETSPVIGSYVHKVTIWVIPDLSPDFEVGYSPDAVASALRSLINLRSVAIYSWTSSFEIYWDELPSSFTSELYRLFELPTLTTMVLNFIQNFNIAPCIGLETLSLTNSSLDQNFPGQVTSMAPIKSFQLIHLSNSINDHGLLAQLMSLKFPDGTFTFDFERLESFEMTFVNMDDVREASKFLQQLKFSSLKRLHFDFLKPIHDDEIVVLFLPRAMKTIKNLEISFDLDFPVRDYLHGICALLESLSNDNQIQIIKFSIGYSPDASDVGNDPNWDILNNTLLALRWPSLTKVDLQITSTTYHSHPSESLSEKISIRDATVAKLPETRLRGLSSSQSFEFIWNFKPIVRSPSILQASP